MSSSTFAACINNVIPLDSLMIYLITLNVCGFISNIDYINYLVRHHNELPLILCISEHWLHTYDSHSISLVTGPFHSVVESAVEKDVYVPRLTRGKSGVAILWSSILSSYISEVSLPRSDRIVGIRIRAL